MVTHEDLAAELRAIEAALADRITIVREILSPDGRVVATYRRTIILPKEKTS